MEAGQWMPLVGGIAAGTVMGLGLTWAWLSQRVRTEQQRLQASEQTRLQLQQQLTQARKQIEQLQRDMHELRLAVRPAPRPAPPPPSPMDRAEATRRYAESLLNGPAPAEKPPAFRDTVVMGPGQ